MRGTRASVVGALVPLTLLLTGFAVAAASATSGHASYRLTHAGQKCRAGYIRTVRHVKKIERGKAVTVREVWCFYRFHLIRTTVGVSTLEHLPGKKLVGPREEPKEVSTPGYWEVYAPLWRGPPGQAHGQADELRGLPITLTIFDKTANQAVASFTARASFQKPCALAFKVENGNVVFFGEAQEDHPLSGVRHYEACSLVPVTMPARDVPWISASFAGNSTYAASKSKEGSEEALCHGSIGQPTACK
jgi:hypothetical protein